MAFNTAKKLLRAGAHRMLPACLLLLVTPVSVVAGQPDLSGWSPDAERALRAVERYLETDLEQWRYARLSVYKGEVRRDMHDPRRPGAEHWRLDSIDGAEPTARQREDYEDDRVDHSGDHRDRLAGAYVASMIVPESVHLVRSTPEYEIFEYDLRTPDGRFEGVYEGLRGDLWLVRGSEAPTVQRVRLWNAKPLRPFPGFTVHLLRMDFRFTEASGMVVPSGVDAQWEARALGIADFGRRLTVRLTDFRRVHTGEEAVPGAAVMKSPEP